MTRHNGKHDPVLATRCARGQRAPAPAPETGSPSAEPLYQTTVFEFPDVSAATPALDGTAGYAYARHGLPNARSLELSVAALEAAEDGLATSSGMAAIGCATLGLLPAGARVLYQGDAYGGTSTLLEQDLPRLGYQVAAVDPHQPEALTAALSRGADMLLVESLSNPLVQSLEIAPVADLCRASGTILAVDNTFATPLRCRPLEQGAQLVIHSASKFLGGHHDLCAGVLVGEASLVARARGFACRFGSVAAPLDAWLTARGLRTLDVRMERAERNARALAEGLQNRQDVRTVHYPGWSNMLSFDVGSETRAEAIVTALSGTIPLVVSLGGTATSVSHPATSSHRGLAPEQRRRLGIADGLLRLSVGLEEGQALLEELEATLEHCPELEKVQ